MVELGTVLVATPYRVSTNPKLVARARELFQCLTWPPRVHALYPNDYGYSPDYSSNARARNDVIEKWIVPAAGGYSHVLWIDVDIERIPDDLIERLHAYGQQHGAEVIAPRVMVHWLESKPARDLWYDIGGFVQDGHWVSQTEPYFDFDRALDSVGACYLIPADVFLPHAVNGEMRPGARFAPGFTFHPNRMDIEHYSVMHAARAMGYTIRCNPEATAWHAYLPAWSMQWQTDQQTA